MAKNLPFVHGLTWISHKFRNLGDLVHGELEQKEPAHHGEPAPGVHSYLKFIPGISQAYMRYISGTSHV